MQDFIVLGIIPGTDYQLTFTFWLAVAGTLVVLPVLVRLWRRRYAFAAILLSLYVARLISRRRLLA